MDMKGIVLYFCCLVCCLTQAGAQVLEDGAVGVSGLHAVKDGDLLFVSMDLDASALKLRTNQEVVLTPVLVAGDRRVELPPVYFAGRNRYYSRLRRDASPAYLYRARKNPVVRYQETLPFEAWMGQAEWMMEDSRCGCLDEVLAEDQALLRVLDFAPKRFVPVFVYLVPVVSDKVREVKTSAYIDFPVGQVRIDRNFRNNAAELQTIVSTIDSVKNDPDTRISTVSVKGFASPEGSYALNRRLAMERTKALMQYVQQLYAFPAGVVRTAYEAEDWEGVKEYVEKSALPHRTELLALINDANLSPDRKDWRMKTAYPADYRLLLADCYPSLRRSDYAVGYTIRAYTDVEEAKRIMQTRPGNLSLDEFYRVAQTYEPGSEEYDDVFDTMVRIYPDDETANLNAANVAMSRGDMASARKFLAKAGDSGKASYARGMFAAIGGDYGAARSYLLQAQKEGVAEAAPALKQLDEMEEQG